MTLKVVFRRAARMEFTEAAAWYDRQRPGLGHEFVTEIERCIAFASEHPKLHAPANERIQRIPTRRFPYTVYFRVEPRRIVILAVFHGSRDPRIWRRRT